MSSIPNSANHSATSSRDMSTTIESHRGTPSISSSSFENNVTPPQERQANVERDQAGEAVGIKMDSETDSNVDTNTFVVFAYILFGIKNDTGTSQEEQLCIWELLRISTTLIVKDLLTDGLEVEPAREYYDISWWARQLDGEVSDTRDWVQATKRFMSALGELRQVICQENDALDDEVGQHLVHLIDKLDSDMDSDMDSDTSLFPALWSWFHAIAKLFSNVCHILKQDSRLRLKDLKGVPHRHQVLEQTVSAAPSNKELPTAIANIMSTQPAHEHECSICAVPFSDPSTPNSYVSPNKDVVPWLRVGRFQHGLVIEEGFEHVPLKMPCGHVFGSGCIKLWLDADTCRTCPRRDLDYGVHALTAVMEIEDLGRKYGMAV